MENRKPVDIDSFHTKIIYLGLLLNVFVPALFLITGIFLRNQGIMTAPAESLRIFLVVLLIVSGGEVAAIFVLKKKFLFGQGMIKSNLSSQSPEQAAFKSSLIIFALDLSPTIYGLVYYLLGGTIEWFVIFIAITLLSFQLFKPKVDEVKSLLGDYDQQFEWFYRMGFENKKGKVQDFLLFLVNGKNINILQGFDTELKQGDTIAILPPVGGG